MTSLAALSIDQLADGICLRAGRIAAAQAELLRWIAEFDRREGWAGPGMLSCAHWLSWRIGLSLGTARDQVRVARRLDGLPQLAAAFADGRVSYSKVRAITRVAQSDDGIDWIELARSSSAAQLDTLVRGIARARAAQAAQDDPEQAAWRLRTRTRYDSDGSFVLTIRGPAHLLPVIQAGLDAKKTQLRREQQAAAGAADAATADAAVEDVPAATAPAPGQDFPSPAAPALISVADLTAAPASAEPSSDDQPDVAPDDRAGDRPDDRPDGRASDGPSDDPELDAQAPGWPAGTTVRQVIAAADHVTALQRQLGAEQRYDEPHDTGPVVRPAPTTPPPPPDLRRHTDDGTDAHVPSDADALLALARDALDSEHTRRPDLRRRRRWQLTAQLDPLSGWARQTDGELLPPSTLTAVLKTLPGRGGVLRLRPLTPADLRRSDLGRTSRTVSDDLRELLSAVDGERCRMPGCTRRRNLHAHHVQYWSQGGPTDLANLVLVCSRHHTLIHTQGLQLVLHPDRRLQVHTADGIPVQHHPAQPWADPAELTTTCGQLVSAETLQPEHTSSRLDLHYAVSVLMAQAA